MFDSKSENRVRVKVRVRVRVSLRSIPRTLPAQGRVGSSQGPTRMQARARVG